MRRLLLILISIFCPLSVRFMAYSQKWVSLNESEQSTSVCQTVLKDYVSGYKVEITINGFYL